MDDTCRQKYIHELEFERHRYMGILERLFGPCDSKFVFGTIGESKDDVPRTHFPSNYHTNGGCVVDIHIGKFAWENSTRNQSIWQLAHECVHLIDPGKHGSANVLEEGLATWFQCEPQYHDKLVKDYIGKHQGDKFGMPSNYVEAWRLVCCCMPHLTSAVKTIRKYNRRIREISPDMLATCLQGRNIRRETIEKLCSPF